MRNGRSLLTTGKRMLPLVLGGWLSCLPCCCAFVGPIVSSALGASADADASARCFELAIEGMTCKECATHVQNALAKVPGVAEAKVNYAKAEASVCSKPGANVAAETLVKAVEKAGYKAKVKRQSQN